MKVIRTVLTAVGVLAVLLFSPLASFCFNGGNIVGMSGGAVLILLGVFLLPVCRFVRFLAGRRQGTVLLFFVSLILVFALTLAVIASVRIVSGASKTDKNCKTVIVLGCYVKDGRPGTMLTMRLDTAYEWLTENPEGVAILSGGQGPDEEIPEAQAMFTYLADRGINEKRLYVETKSESTEENIAFSKEIIEENGLSTEIATVTQSFHQYRASVIAERCGLEWSAVNSATPVLAYPTYFLREVCGIMLMILGLY